MKGRASVLVALIGLIASAPAGADTTGVQIVDTAYNPPQLVVLTGDAVGWRNSSFINQHTVTAPTFDSGPIQPGGGYFHDFTAPGAYPYACTIHTGMSGEVDVFGLLMKGPDRTVARGAETALTGRAAADIGSISIEGDTGAGFHQVATTQASGGTFKAIVHPPAPATYRAVAGPNTSPSVQVQVSNRSDVSVRVSRGALRVHVDPANPGAKVSLQFKLRERFGWWTVARARLDKRSDARFVVRRSKAVRARVLLTLDDGWTPLAASAAVRVLPRGRTSGR
jgi:plastocyanin